MITLKRYLKEYEEGKAVDLFFGRFQPFHKGHAQAVAQMQNPVVAIVKGAKSSLDKASNPLTFEEQKKLINKVFPDVLIIEAKSGYVPDIIQELRIRGLEVRRVFAGSDRFKDYNRQIESFNKMTTDKDQKMHVQLIEPLRITSATFVREAVKKDDFKVYASLMPKELATNEVFRFLQARVKN